MAFYPISATSQNNALFEYSSVVCVTPGEKRGADGGGVEGGERAHPPPRRAARALLTRLY